MSSNDLIEKCREYRKNLTEAEAALWKELRAKKILGYKFRRQHPMGGYILDFYCAEVRLAIEVDGSMHQDQEQIEYDRHRSSNQAEMDIEVLRFWNDEVLNKTGSVIEKIIRKIEQQEKELGCN